MTKEGNQSEKWLAAGLRLGFDVIAPCKVVLSDGSILEATALVKVGPPNGIVVDPEWSVLKPYASQLVAEGFGYSAVEIEDGDISDMLLEWCGN